MIKILSNLLICLTLLSPTALCQGQKDSLKIDSLKKALLTQKADTGKFNTLMGLTNIFLSNRSYENSLMYGNQALELAKKIDFKSGVATAYANIGWSYSIAKNDEEAFKSFSSQLKISREMSDQNSIAVAYLNLARFQFSRERYIESLEFSNDAISISEQINNKTILGEASLLQFGVYSQWDNYAEALKHLYVALKVYEELSDNPDIATCLQFIGATEATLGNNKEALHSYLSSLKIRKEIGDKSGIAQTQISIGDIYTDEGNYNAGRQNHFEGLRIFKELGNEAPDWGIPFAYESIAADYQKEGEILYSKNERLSAREKFSKALEYAFLSFRIWRKIGRMDAVPENLQRIGNLYLELGNKNQAKIYLEKSLKGNLSQNSIAGLRDNYHSLSRLDSIQGNYQAAYEHYKMFVLNRDSLFNEANTKKTLNVKMQYEFDKKETIAKANQAKKDTDAKRTRNQQYFTIAALGILVLAVVAIAMVQFRSNRRKQQANIALQQQKEQVEITLSELKSAQSQLIQSEKMASLGELTAGIAHEIQNPLNFVNNFSEVNKELLVELKEEADKGNIDEVKTIADDVIANEEKITHHGKRADAIVKGMLQHSRSSTGVKEPTDINALCDEYLRLSYHGLRAKDKNFNADFKTDFDNSIGKVNIVPQDIGRVLLNLFNNAFYAANEKKKNLNTADNLFVPRVTIVTKKLNDKIEIAVTDNGNGIPQKLVDKIFQPFFTTKPTGQGTGLGLSLSYDIIKAHGGEIKVETKEGEGSTFIIQLQTN